MRADDAHTIDGRQRVAPRLSAPVVADAQQTLDATMRARLLR